MKTFLNSNMYLATTYLRIVSNVLKFKFVKILLKFNLNIVNKKCKKQI